MHHTVNMFINIALYLRYHKTFTMYAFSPIHWRNTKSNNISHGIVSFTTSKCSYSHALLSHRMQTYFADSFSHDKGHEFVALYPEFRPNNAFGILLGNLSPLFDSLHFLAILCLMCSKQKVHFLVLITFNPLQPKFLFFVCFTLSWLGLM